MPLIQTFGAASSRGFGLFMGSSPYWIATLGDATPGGSYAVALDSSSNVYIAGYVNSTAGSIADAVIAKYNNSGLIQWQRTLSGTNNDINYGIAVDSSGNSYVTGQIRISSTNAIGLAKYDTSGAIQWQRSLSGATDERGAAIAVDSSSNVYIVGYTDSGGAGLYDALISKYNSSGTIQWQRVLGGAGNEYGYGVAVDSSGNIYVTGSTGSAGAGFADILIAKYNTSGTIQWQRVLGGTGADTGTGVALDSSSNVYVVGGSNSSGTAGSTDAVITKYNSSGTIQWQRVLGGANTDAGNGISVDSAGNVYITGQSIVGTSLNILIAKYDTSGTIQWQRNLTGSGSQQGYGVSVDALGNLYVTGQTDSSGAGSTDMILCRLPTDGTKTGTYGAYTYQASSLTAATSTFTAATSSLTDSAATLTSAASALTDAAGSLTSTVTKI